MDDRTRREFVKRLGMAGAALALFPLDACAHAKVTGLPLIDPPTAEDKRRLEDWVARLRPPPGMRLRKGPLNGYAATVGSFAIGTPYEPFTLERYLKAGGDATQSEPLALSLTKFDCVTLVESCIAVARLERFGMNAPSWEGFAGRIEEMRYRGGVRLGFASRLHYFSEWISDGVKRGLLKEIGKGLGGVEDARPLRFMTEHRASYPGLNDDSVFKAIHEMERSLDLHPRYVVPTDRIASVEDQIESGDVLAFVTAIPGLDVTHAAFAYRAPGDWKTLRVLHAPLSGGSVEISRRTLSDYVAAIKRSTGILVARPIG